MADNTNTQQVVERDKGLVIDPSKLTSAPRGIKNKLNPDDDAWSISAPPAHDIYCLKPVLGKNGIKYFKGEGSKPEYYSLNIEHRIIAESDPDVHQYPAFQSLTTKIGRGKQISTAAGFIKKLGFKVPTEADDLEIVSMLVEVLRNEKVLFGEIDWRGSFLDPDGSWKNVCSSANDFPKDPETGERLHRMRITNSKGTPVEVTAQLSVNKLYSRKEYKELSETGELEKLRASFGIGQVLVNKAQLAEEEEVVVAAPVKVKKTKEAPEPVAEVSQQKLAMALVEDE